MGKRNKAFDAYIKSKPDWAQPILTSVRETIHQTCPEVEEEMKWGHLGFVYKGLMAGMVAFKERCGLHFWKSELVVPKSDPNYEKLSQLTTVKDLPPKKTLQGYVKKAMALNESGTAAPKRPAKPKKELVIPDYFMTAIRKNKRALATYEKFSPSNQRDYIEWITDAKGDDTRDRRVAQAVEWMAEGKPRNWKYMR